MNIDCFYIKEKLEEKILRTVDVDTADHFADIITKGLPIKAFSSLISKLGMSNIHFELEGEC